MKCKQTNQYESKIEAKEEEKDLKDDHLPVPHDSMEKFRITMKNRLYMYLERRKAYNPPVPWTEEEESLLLGYLINKGSEGNILKDIFPERTLPGIRSKIRKLRIKHDLFGYSYREEKEVFTLKIAKRIKPNTVFDAYSGAGHQTFKWIKYANKVYASEKMESKLEQFERTVLLNEFEKIDTKDCLWRLYRKNGKEIYFFIGDTVDAAADLKVNNVNVDLLDLDTCGSTLPLLPTFLVLLKPKDLVITHGEFHSMRFKREDVLRRLLSHKDVTETPFPLNVDEMGIELDKAVKISGLRAHNETIDSFWLELESEEWLGSRYHGMLRRHYSITKPSATSDCINTISKL